MYCKRSYGVKMFSEDEHCFLKGASPTVFQCQAYAKEKKNEFLHDRDQSHDVKRTGEHQAKMSLKNDRVMLWHPFSLDFNQI